MNKNICDKCKKRREVIGFAIFDDCSSKFCRECYVELKKVIVKWLNVKRRSNKRLA